MIKYLRICSDLHLEGFSGRDPRALMDMFLPEDPRDKDSALILAGDISSQPDQLEAFLKETLNWYQKVLFVPGNHEFYRQHMDAWTFLMKAKLDALNSDKLEYVLAKQQAFKSVTLDTEAGPIRFLLTTLWGDGGPTTQDNITTSHCLNDFRLIMHEEPPRRFTVFDMMDTFKRQKRRLNEELLQPFAGKTVVVTHHLPSRQLVSARFWPSDGSDGSNGGFVGDCDSILAYDHAPDLWIHGHTHDTIDTTLWTTRIVSNPAGYRSEWQTPHNGFWSAVDGKPFALPKFIDVNGLHG